MNYYKKVYISSIFICIFSFFTLAINRSFTNWFPSIVLSIRSTVDALVIDIFLHIDTLISSIHHFSIMLYVRLLLHLCFL